MIQWMHRLSQSLPATLLMGVLALSFVVWGIADVFTGQSSQAVATVGGTEIDAVVFQRDYKNFVRTQSQQSGQQITPDMAQKMGLGTAELQQMISRTALDNLAKKEGLTTTDAQLVQFVHGMDVFKGPTGQFDRATFNATLANANYTDENSFLSEIRADLTRNQMTGAVEAGFSLPQEYALAVYLYINEKRAADYVVVTPEMAGDVAAPDDKTLATFVKTNAPRFSTPEYRDVQYAWVAPTDVPVTVSEAQIAQAYTAKKDTYNVPEKRELSQIEFKNETEAKAARAKIDGGMSFEALAASRGLKPADTLLGADVTKASIPDAARADAAFALTSGEVSQPLKGALNWVILKVGKITPGTNRSLADAHDEIKTNLTAELQGGKIVDMLNAFQDAKNAGDDLATAAKKVGLKLGRIAAMDSHGLAPDSTKTEAPADPEFLAAVFRGEAGEDSDPVSAKSGAYYVVRVNGITPPKLKSLDAVRADAQAQWIAQKRGELLAVKAKALADQAIKDKSLNGIAAALKVSIQKSPRLSRTTSDTMFSSDFITKLYDAKPGGIVSAPQGLSGNYIIAQLSGITHPRPEQNSREFAAAGQQLSANIAGDISISMANAERTAQGVKVNQKQLDSVVGSGL